MKEIIQVVTPVTIQYDNNRPDARKWVIEQACKSVYIDLCGAGHTGGYSAKSGKSKVVQCASK